MKKKLLIILSIIATICFGFYLFLTIFLLNGNHVVSYGRSKTLSQIINIDEERISSYNNDSIDFTKYTFKRALTKNLGATHHVKYTLDKNEIIFIGNRNLVKINDKLYVYSRGK